MYLALAAGNLGLLGGLFFVYRKVVAPPEPEPTEDAADTTEAKQAATEDESETEANAEPVQESEEASDDAELKEEPVVAEESSESEDPEIDAS